MSSADYYRQASMSDVNLTEYGKQQQQTGYQGIAPNLSKNRGPQRASSRFGGKKWIAIGGIAVLVVAGAVVGGIVGANAAKKTSGKAQTGVSGAVLAADGAITTINGTPQYPINGNSVPLYPSTASSAAGSSPTAGSTAQSACGTDSFTGTSNSLRNFQVRTDHPVLVAPQYRWDCLPSQIAADPYMNAWNTTIFLNATKFAAMDPQPYTTDGGLSGSGVLDPAREIQLRMKHWAYAWRMTNDTKWSDRAWLELQTAAGNNSDVAWGTGATDSSWNTQHFLDLAEFTAAFAYGYDWMYDAWTDSQRQAIMWSIINLGLRWGLESYDATSQAHESYGWWQTTNGNWNCVCNKGLTWGALAILNDDPTGIAQQVLGHTVQNSLGNCYQGVQDDGTWTETSDYWYFGSTSAAELWSGLQTATGIDFTSMVTDANPNYSKTGEFHMYGTGTVEKFNYGDCGPNKYTATANCMMFFGDQLNVPEYTLYQRERVDAPEPLSMFWYNSKVQGDWWDGLALDNSFTDTNDTWVSMRSSWTDPNALYAAMKAGKLLGHQTHGNLDNGDFVFEALGQRWAGELCQAQYLADGYFSSEAQNSERWLYYRTRTEGQNTLVINYANQDVDADPTILGYESNGAAQTTLGSQPDSTSTAFWITDMSSAYNSTTSVHRGMRLINGRRQLLIQDEVSGPAGDIQWRMHTNATISYSNSNALATLSLGGETMQASILSPSGATFATLPATRYDSDPPLPADSISQDLPNPGVSVLSITLTGGDSQTIEVLLSPEWGNGFAAATPPSVSLDNWSLTSHS